MSGRITGCTDNRDVFHSLIAREVDHAGLKSLNSLVHPVPRLRSQLLPSNPNQFFVPVVRDFAISLYRRSVHLDLTLPSKLPSPREQHVPSD